MADAKKPEITARNRAKVDAAMRKVFARLDRLAADRESGRVTLTIPVHLGGVSRPMVTTVEPSGDDE